MLPNQRWYCSIHMSFVPSGTFCSTYFIVFMTFERFYSIVRPHKAASFNTVKRAKVTIACVIVFAFSYYLPFWFIADNIGRYCIISKKFVHSKYGSLYFWLGFSIRFALPFMSLLGMNTVIINTLRKRSQWVISKPECQGQNKRSSDKTNLYYIASCNICIFNPKHSHVCTYIVG